MKRTFLPGFLGALLFSGVSSLRAQGEVQFFIGGHDPGSELTGVAFDRGAVEST